ncbi:amidohydrolase [Lacibacter sp. MH-610]|uniref:amidohydrolase n=1 Tax=Lacibacter sp. MH-610 TaxID=3020883 RepID=UPI0038912DF6
MRIITLLLCLMGITLIATAQKKQAVSKADQLKKEAALQIQNNYDQYKTAALQIWDYAEVGYKEVKSSALLQQTLKDNGFTIESGVAGMPTAFVATYGSGSPVIGILAEFDALPGLSQTIAPVKTSGNKNAGHACGHHLFGVASAASGIAIKQLIEQKKLTGTIKVFGCPAEEGGGGKIYLVREGFFKSVDVAIHWHPGSENLISTTSSLANISAKFRFYGISAHASGAPDRGRSSLDAVEAMNNMINLMREHVPQETRIHYVITKGGLAPNVVPDFAEVYYTVRHPRKEVLQSIFDRIVNAGKGAAMGTETRMEYEIIGGVHELLINHSLAEVMYKNLEMTGGVQYTPEEMEFAKKIQATFDITPPPVSNAGIIKPLKSEREGGGGSTDVGDVSYAVPTVGLRTATWVPGTPAHSWQAVACGGTEIGTKGMIVAAKTMAMTAIDLFLYPELITKAKEEFEKAKGSYQYKPLLGDRKPALNYRD